MRFRTTLILALVFIGLGAYLYFVERERAAEEAKKETLFDVDQDKVTSVTLTYPDRKIVVKKADGTWRLVEPVDDLADETAVTNLVKAIAECEVKRTLDDVPSDLAPYGLDKPTVEVAVGLTDGTLPTIRVGKNTPVGFSTYIQRADDPKVKLTAAAFHSGMDKQVKDLRDKQVLTFQDDQIRSITLQGEQGTVALKKTDGTWALEQPAAYPADASAVRGFLSSLRSLRANDFVAETDTDLAQYGLDHPRVTITVVGDKADEQKQVLVGGETDKKDIYLKVGGRPTVYTVGSFAWRDLGKTANDFRDKTILAFAPDDVTGIDLRRDDGSVVTLSRKEKDTWALGGNDAAPESPKVTQFLTDLKDLKGYEIAADGGADLSQFGLAPPQLSIVLHGKDGDIGTILFGSHAAEGEGKSKEFTALRDGQQTVFRIREHQFNKVNKKEQDFLPKPTPTRTTSAPQPTPNP